MAPILFSVNLEHLSGLVEDRYINNWVFLTPTAAPTDAEMDQVLLSLNAFYNTPAPSVGNSVNDHLSRVIDRTADHQVKAYDLTGHLNGTPHGSPVRTTILTLTASPAADSDLPSEVASCLSFKTSFVGDPEFGPGTRPRGRDRGRIYLGPLNQRATVQGADHVPRVNDNFRNCVLERANVLMTDAGHAWSVWSRRGASVDPVTGGWMDNAFDIQRRRGEKATGRTTFGSML